MNIFITGTDTDIGKTVVSSWICRQTNAQYWKPIQTGDDSDTATVQKFSPLTKVFPNAYKLKAPLSAYDGARLENVTIDIDKIIGMCPKNNTVIEGAGGALVPITDNIMMADLIKELNSKVIIVAKSKLGFLNHIFLTVETLKSRGIDIIGIILNGKTELIDTIEKFARCDVLDILTCLDDIDTKNIPSLIMDCLNQE